VGEALAVRREEWLMLLGCRPIPDDVVDGSIAAAGEHGVAADATAKRAWIVAS